MTENVSNLYKEGKIDKYDYDTYVLFELNELGREYLKNIIEMILLEEPAESRRDSYAWNDGRRSCWREIKSIINIVKLKLKDYENDRDKNRR